MTNIQGGTPESQSIKKFERLGINTADLESKVIAEAGTNTDTPCMQNEIDGYATIEGPYDYYDVVVFFQGVVNEGRIRKPANGRASGGLGWYYDDYDGNYFDRGIKSAKSSSSLSVQAAASDKVSTKIINHSFRMRIKNDEKTLLGGGGISGGIIVIPQANFEISVEVNLFINFWIQILRGYTIRFTGVGKLVPHVINPRQITGEEGETEMEEVFQVSTYILEPVDDDFQYPELREQTGKAASVFDSPEITKKIDEIKQKYEKLNLSD